MHKKQCKDIQREAQAIREGDENAVQKAASASTNQSLLLPSQVADELRDFVKHFSPYILATAVNAFRASRADRTIVGWEDDLLLVKIDRRKDVKRNSPFWSRFTVDRGFRAAVEDMHAEMGTLPEFAHFAATRPILIQEAKRRGPGNGVIYVWLVCWSDAGTIQAPYPLQFSPEVAGTDFLPRGLEPVDYFRGIVDAESMRAMK